MPDASVRCGEKKEGWLRGEFLAKTLKDFFGKQNMTC